MRRCMLPVAVELRDERPLALRWRDDGGALRHERVARVIDDWSYVGRWWEREVRREYVLVETARGATVELFREGEAWCLSRRSD